jgi:uncharacterized membrane protein YeiH
MSLTATLLLAAASVPATAPIVAGVSSAATAALGATSTLESFMTSTVPSIVASVLPSVTTTAAVTSGHVTVPLGLELAAVFTGALFGGIRAVEKRFDIVGVLTLAMTGLVGGIVRDLILQKYGVAAFASNRYLLTAIAAGLVAFFFASAASRLRPAYFLIDALSLGLFAVAGADKALFAGFAVVPAILLGMMTAVGGGLARDLLFGDPPELLRPGLLNGVAATLGATMYVLSTSWLGINKLWAAAVTVAVVLLVRILAVRLGWQSPAPRDLTAVVGNASRRVAGWGRGAMRMPWSGRASRRPGPSDDD